MAKNLLKYEEKFQVDILKRYYSGKGKMCYFEYEGIQYFTNGYIIYKVNDELVKLDCICEKVDFDALLRRCEVNNTHKLRYNGITKDNLYLYLTDSNIEVYINPKLLKLFDKPEELELWCDGTSWHTITIKAFSDNVIGYVLPMRVNR